MNRNSKNRTHSDSKSSKTENQPALNDLTLKHIKILIRKTFSLMEEILEKDPQRFYVTWYRNKEVSEIFVHQIFLYEDRIFSLQDTTKIPVMVMLKPCNFSCQHFEDFSGFTTDFLKKVLQHLKRPFLNDPHSHHYELVIFCKHKQKISEHTHFLDFNGNNIVLITRPDYFLPSPNSSNKTIPIRLTLHSGELQSFIKYLILIDALHIQEINKIPEENRKEIEQILLTCEKLKKLKKISNTITNKKQKNRPMRL